MTTIHEEQGIMDIGKHCSVCHRLDFLPFTCPKCHMSFCGEHRADFNSHKCIVEMNLKKNRIPPVNTRNLPPASSLFPDLDKLREKANERAKRQNGGDHVLGSEGGNKYRDDSTNRALSSAEHALSRLKVLLGGKKEAANRGAKLSILHRFSSKSTLQIVELAKLKKAAKGDPKVSSTQRIYIWCVYVEDFQKSNSVSEKTELWVSKAWPIGRMLDSCTEQMKVKNLNNRVTDKSQRLTVFRKRRPNERASNDAAGISDAEFVYLSTAGRVSKEIRDNDVIYLVRGAKRELK
ncbi:hypothetical protein FOA43_000241 [Brettanomyces nanus]|uniref:ZFAND1-like ubiquitin-like domain-containing protein n=1 Tax=Eeniella nana TaxID=13502 RepID=A0A875RSW8_EENNA|nr:uncharacterized protein FOA43_000241 [Brettanomyces nanus]QPG72937.1 hypothetical protein FOA43_000241 [Brettanomyces nanus]